MIVLPISQVLYEPNFCNNLIIKNLLCDIVVSVTSSLFLTLLVSLHLRIFKKPLKQNLFTILCLHLVNIKLEALVMEITIIHSSGHLFSDVLVYFTLIGPC